jgi:O-antigen/teichoic acid export membrane protein
VTTGRTEQRVLAGDSDRTGARPPIGSLPALLLARLSSDAMLRNSLFIMATSVVTSLFGYVFWLIVARTLPASVSGAGAAATSALQATALFACVGAAAAMIEWLPRSRSALEWRRRATAGVLVSAVAAAVAGVLVVGLLGHLLHTLPALASAAGGTLFCLGTVFFAVGTVLDYVAVSERSGGRMLARNALFTAARIPLLLLPWLLPGTTDQILTSWAVAGGVALLIGLTGFRGSTHGRSMRPAFGGLAAHVREMMGSLVGQHFITIAAMLASYLLPIVVVARVSAAANAYFYATWMLGAVFFMISPAVSTSLFAEAAGNPGQIGALARRCARIIAALLVVPMAVYLVGGGLLLELFGPAYPHEGRLLLVLLTVSTVPDAVTNIAVAMLRATNRLRTALWLNTAMLVVSLVLSWLLLPGMGIVGVGVSWLVAQTGGALWALACWRRLSTPAAASTPTAASAAAPSAPTG